MAKFMLHRNSWCVDAKQKKKKYKREKWEKYGMLHGFYPKLCETIPLSFIIITYIDIEYACHQIGINITYIYAYMLVGIAKEIREP